MKKIVLLLAILLLTGCLGETGKGYIIKTCSKDELVNGLNVNTSVTVKSKSGDIESLKIVETYDKEFDLSSITKSKKSEQNYYIKENGITLDINDNVFVYSVDVQEVSNVIKERLNIKDEQHKQVDFYESLGYVCK